MADARTCGDKTTLVQLQKTYNLIITVRIVTNSNLIVAIIVVILTIAFTVVVSLTSQSKLFE